MSKNYKPFKMLYSTKRTQKLIKSLSLLHISVCSVCNDCSLKEKKKILFLSLPFMYRYVVLLTDNEVWNLTLKRNLFLCMFVVYYLF